MENNQTFMGVVWQAVADLIQSEVSGSLLVLSLALNTVLLTPIIYRYLKGFVTT